MITIFFDNELVNDDDYLEIKNEYKMFDKNFYLGATPCNSYTLKVPNTYTIPNEVKIKMDDEDYATLIVDKYSIDDNDILTLKLVDKMILFNKNYDASGIVPCTVLDILSDICNTCGVQLGTDSFTNDDIPVNYYDNTITAREYIGMIAELNGGYACIGNDGKLYLRKFNNTPIELSIDLCENFKIAEKRKVERVVFDNGLLKFQTSSDESLETLYLNNQNVYINNETTFNNIANQILNFEFYNFSTGNCQVDYTATCGKLIKFVDSDNNEYVSIAQYNHNYNGEWLGGYELNLESVLQAETQIKGDSEKIKSIKITQDRQQNEIDVLVEDIDDQNEQIADIRLKYNEILSRISDIADITTSGESSYASVNLIDVNASQPIDIKIRPINENICFLYPRDNLYPSDALYPYCRILRFTNNTTNEVLDWELPTNLWWYDATTYDELELSYGDGENSNVVVTRRCEINSSGVVSAKATPTTETYAYPTSLVLTDGDYTITLLSHTSAYLYVQLMAKNIYTTQFYTRAETNSLIDQTSSSIDLSVDQKLSNYSTTTQMNSAITLKANEITSNVSETYATKTTTNTLSSRITQNADSISNEVTRATDSENSLSSRISQTAKTIDLSVSDNGTSAGINIKLKNENGTQIDSDNANITMSGLVKFTDLSGNGTTTINGANITTGTISASRLDSSVITTSNLSAQSISANNITSGTLNVDRISANSITSGKIAGTLTSKTLSSSAITGSSINTTSGNFKVTANGFMTAKSGTFGAWTLDGSGILSNDAKIYPSQLHYKTNGTGGWVSCLWWKIGQAGTLVSDKRYKKNIKQLQKSYDNFFDELKPISFKWKNKKMGERIHIGFIAQDILKAEKNNNLDLDMVIDDGKCLNLDKREIIALNTWQIQMLKEQVKYQQEQIDLLKKEIEILKGGK